VNAYISMYAYIGLYAYIGMYAYIVHCECIHRFAYQKSLDIDSSKNFVHCFTV
jgi:hypothetical protein